MALSQAADVIVLMAVFSILPIVAVVLRFYARSLQPTKLAWDDWLIIPGLICTVGLNVTVLIGVCIANLGSHKTDATSRETMIVYNKLSWAVELLNVPAIIFVKASIVMFYYRIFEAQGRVYKTVLWALLGLIFLRIAFFFASLLKCVPIENIWLVNTPGRGGCVQFITDYQVSAITSAITDFLILMVPIPPIWQMRLPLRKKLAVMGIFLLGGFTVIAAVLRIYFFQSVGNQIRLGLTDTTYYQAPVYYWTAIENAVAVICACLPLMRTIVISSSLRRVLHGWACLLRLRRSRGSTSDGSSDQGDMKSPRKDLGAESSMWPIHTTSAHNKVGENELSSVTGDTREKTEQLRLPLDEGKSTNCV